MRDKRSYTRILADLDTVVFPSETFNNNLPIEIMGTILNISECGLCIFVNNDQVKKHDFNIGENITFEFTDSFRIDSSCLNYIMVKTAIIRNIVKYDDGIRLGLCIHDSDFAKYTVMKMLNKQVRVGVYTFMVS